MNESQKVVGEAPHWERYERAARMREQEGKSLKEIGDTLGVSPQRARQLVYKWHLRKAANAPLWATGLSREAVAALMQMEFTTMDEVLLLASNGLRYRNQRFDDPRRPPEALWSLKHSIRPQDLNEIRRWLGVPPLLVPLDRRRQSGRKPRRPVYPVSRERLANRYDKEE